MPFVDDGSAVLEPAGSQVAPLSSEYWNSVVAGPFASVGGSSGKNLAQYGGLAAAFVAIVWKLRGYMLTMAGAVLSTTISIRMLLSIHIPTPLQTIALKLRGPSGTMVVSNAVR